MRKLFPIFCLLILGVACDKGSSDTPNGAVDMMARAGLTGIWRAPCETLSSGSMARELEFTTYVFKLREKFYSDESCTQPFHTFVYHGSGNIEGGIRDSPAVQINMSLKYVWWDLYKGEVGAIETLKIDEVCADSSVISNLDPAFYQRICGSQAFPRSELFDIYMTEGRQLRFGNLTNAKAETRPKKLGSAIFIRQE